MNSLAVEHLAPDPMVAAFAQLDPATQREVVARAVNWGVERGVSDWLQARRGGLEGLGQDVLTASVAAAVQRAIEPLIPTLGAKLMEIVEPAAKKAADIVGPVVRAELEAKAPAIAISTGIVAGILSVIGMLAVGGYVVRRTSPSRAGKRK